MQIIKKTANILIYKYINCQIVCACENVVYNTVAQTIFNFAWNVWKTQ